MKGQVVVDTLITAVAIAAAAALILGSFLRIEELAVMGIERQRAKGTAELLSEWGRGCSIQDVNIDFPYDVNMVCVGGTPYISGSGKLYKIEGASCIRNGYGRTVTIASCKIEVR